MQHATDAEIHVVSQHKLSDQVSKFSKQCEEDR